jgi:hypothetical protein
VLVRAEVRAVPAEEAGLGQRVGGGFGPADAEHLRRLRPLAGAGQRLRQARVALQGARRAGGEPLQNQTVVGIVGQRLLGAPGEGVLGRPFRVGQGEGRDLGGGRAGTARLQPHPRHQLLDQRARRLRRRLGLRPAPGGGVGDGDAAAVGAGLRQRRRGGSGEQANGKAKNGAAAHPQVLPEPGAACLSPRAMDRRRRGATVRREPSNSRNKKATMSPPMRHPRLLSETRRGGQASPYDERAGGQ